MRIEERKTMLITGGCRSGKSRYAQEWAERQGSERLYLATARPIDDEMVERIRRHQEGRREGWRTVEEPLEVDSIIMEQGSAVDVILLDCVTIWVSNLLMEDRSDEMVLERVERVGDILSQVPCSVALVTNEVGWGIVPDHPLGRRFRDLAGFVNQSLARAVDRVVLTVAGIPMEVK
jgi:adenosylcobinamide kinase/adenosylcobinamide-phosphate guanylyltransferase